MLNVVDSTVRIVSECSQCRLSFTDTFYLTNKIKMLNPYFVPL